MSTALPLGCRNPGPPAVMEAKSADPGIAELVAALHAHTEAMQALTQSNALLAAVVAELLGEEMGQPVQDEQKAEPLPDNLDAE